MENQSLRTDLAVNIIKKNDNTSDLQFWQHKTPRERINAVEFLRRQYYFLCGCSSIPRIAHIIQREFWISDALRSYLASSVAPQRVAYPKLVHDAL